jgi:hypothetical protein
MNHYTFPDDVDGDVLRRMALSGFDFEIKHDVDFVVEFYDWPISNLTTDRITKYFVRHEIIDHKNGTGEISGVINSLVTYEFVINIQKELSAIAESDNGICEVWGVFH